MLEDLWKVVRSRMEDGGKDKDEAGAKESRTKIPKNLLFKCPRCGNVVFMEEFNAGLKVCPNCSYHARISCQERLDLTVDRGSFVEYDADLRSVNPLGFEGYEDKIAAAQEKTGLKEAVITGECTIRTRKCVIIIMDSRFMMASMGSVVGEKVTRAFERATEKGLPVVAFTASGGARMQEGILSLMQDLGGRRPPLGGGAFIHHRPDRPDHRRRHRLFCLAGGYHHRRAEGFDRLCRPAGH